MFFIETVQILTLTYSFEQHFLFKTEYNSKNKQNFFFNFFQCTVTVIHQSDSPLVPLWAKRTARVEILAAPQQRDGERSVSPGLRLSPHLPNNLHVPVSHQSQCFYNLVGSSKVSSSGLYFLRSEFHLGSFLSREFWSSISGAALPENITEILRENITGWRHRKLISASTRNGTSVQTKDITSFIDRTVGSSIWKCHPETSQENIHFYEILMETRNVLPHYA